jgi:hypothetical protein
MRGVNFHGGCQDFPTPSSVWWPVESYKTACFNHDFTVESERRGKT